MLSEHELNTCLIKNMHTPGEGKCETFIWIINLSGKHL